MKIGDVVYVVGFIIDDPKLGNMRLFRMPYDIRDGAVDTNSATPVVHRLVVTEVHTVLSELTETECKGYVLKDELGQTWHNKYPYAREGQYGVMHHVYALHYAKTPIYVVDINKQLAQPTCFEMETFSRVLSSIQDGYRYYTRTKEDEPTRSAMLSVAPMMRTLISQMEKQKLDLEQDTDDYNYAT